MELELLIKFVNKQTNTAESEIVEKWLAENRMNAEELKKFIEIPEGVKLFDNIDIRKEWPVLRNKLFVREKYISMRFILRIAASIAIFFALAGLLNHILKISNQPIILSNYSNDILNIALPDSSNIYLNRNSTVKYKKNFNKKREITVEGQVFFKVKRDTLRPFVVNAGESNIKVLGTSFTVETKPQSVEVIVASGRVAFYSTIKHCDTLLLLKGDKGVFRNQGICLAKLKNNDLNFLAWENHTLSFVNTPLPQVIHDLERYYKIKITLKDLLISKLHYTSEFKNPSLNEVLNEMELVLNVKYESIDSTIIISPK